MRIEPPEKPHAPLGVGKPVAVGGGDAGRDGQQGKIHPLAPQAVEKQTAFLLRQLDEAAGKFQGVFCIHKSSSVQGAAIPFERMAKTEN
ncbi:hypothetical protein D9M70_480650 [compost metagenome]